MSVFSSPLMLGFDRFEHLLDQLAKSSNEGYPPYNIEQMSDSQIRITLAVAGFFKDDLKITLEQSQLIIHGKQKDDPERLYIHRGIAARQFQRKFVLAEGVSVAGADMDNGLLHIDLQLPVQKHDVKHIEINAKERPSDMKTINPPEKSS